MAKPLGYGRRQPRPQGILQIAATAMSYAVKGVTTERGLDAGDFVLVAYGGAGPLHAAEVAREIGISERHHSRRARRISPRSACCSRICATTSCAPGSRALEDAPFDQIETVYRELEKQGRDAIVAASVKPRRVAVKRAADMRYVGQEHAVTVDLPLRLFARQDRAAIKRAFDAMHARRYGTSAPDEPAEIVSLRSTVTGIIAQAPAAQDRKRGAPPAESGDDRQAQVYFNEGFRRTPIFDACGACSPAIASPVRR